eukprot:g45443.t1
MGTLPPPEEKMPKGHVRMEAPPEESTCEAEIYALNACLHGGVGKDWLCRQLRVTPYLQSGEHLFHCTSPSSATALRSGLLLVPIAPQASLDLLCNPDWTDADVYAQSFSQLLPSYRSHCRIDKVTPDWSDNFAPLRMLICDYDPFEPPFDVFDSWNSYADFVNADTTLSPDICSHADTSNTDV